MIFIGQLFLQQLICSKKNYCSPKIKGARGARVCVKREVFKKYFRKNNTFPKVRGANKSLL